MAQSAAAMVSGFAGAPAIFFAAQLLIAAFLYRSLAKADASRADLHFQLSMIFSLPFIAFRLISRTGALARAEETTAGRTGDSREELLTHIRADWDSYIDFKAVRYGAGTLTSSAVPIVDLLSGSDVEVKRKSIVILHKLRTVKAITLLKKALADSNVEIKFMAASALLNIENDFKERIREAEDELEGADGEDGARLDEMRYNLAALISRYLSSGLLDAIAQKRLSDRMHGLLESFRPDSGRFVEANVLLAQEYYKKASYQQALAMAENAMNSGALAGCDPDVKISIIMLLCEIHYRLRDLTRLRQACSSIAGYLTPELLKKRPELIDFEKSVRYFGTRRGGETDKKAVRVHG